MSTGSVRRLERGDEHLAESACRLFGADGDLDASDFLGRPEACLLVCEVGTDVVGWVYGHELIHPDGERTMLLYALDVVEAHRRQGHATALVTAFLDEARARSCTEVWLLTEPDNDAAIATYRALGGTADSGGETMFTWRLAEGRHS